MTAMRLDSVIASSWSCVTTTKVMPVRVLNVHQLELGVFAQFLVEGAQRFVQKQQLGLLGQGTGQGHALALAARELVRLAPGQLRELHQIEHLLARASLRWAVVRSSCFRP